jgi:hypothetical protein
MESQIQKELNTEDIRVVNINLLESRREPLLRLETALTINEY